MEIIEVAGWLALGFAPMFGGLHILGRKLGSLRRTEKMTVGGRV